MPVHVSVPVSCPRATYLPEATYICPTVERTIFSSLKSNFLSIEFVIYHFLFTSDLKHLIIISAHTTILFGKFSESCNVLCVW